MTDLNVMLHNLTPRFDAHTHVWRQRWQNFALTAACSGEDRQCQLLLALLDQHGVRRACLIAACDQLNPDHNEYVAEICRRFANRFVMLAEVPLAAANRDELLARSLECWPARGIRCFPAAGESPRDWSGPRHSSFWKRADEARFCVCLNLTPAQARDLRELVERFPNIRWVLDHMGRPRHDMAAAEYQPVLDLAAFPNVFVKISGFYAFTKDCVEYPYADLARFLIALRDAYGARRLLWGSDALPVLDFSSYAQTFGCLRHVTGLSAEDCEWILGKTAEQLFPLTTGDHE